MSNDLIPTQDEVKAIEVMAKHAVDSKYVEKLGGYAGVFSIAMYARELGIPVMTALFGGMANIMGKITIAPQLMNAMIRKAGHKLDIDSTEARCIIKGSRKDTGESCTVSFSVDEARKAGIYKEGGGWAKYPSDMCFARALSRLARRLFPDVIGMAYVEGEVEEEEKPKTSKPQKSQEIPMAETEVKEPAEADLIYLCKEKFKTSENIEFPLEGFIEHCAKSSKKTALDIVKSALNNGEKFTKSYLVWVGDQQRAKSKKEEAIIEVQDEEITTL